MSNDLFKKLFILKNGFINTRNAKSLKKTSYDEVYDQNKLIFILNNLDEVKKTYRPEARDSTCLESFYKASSKSKMGHGVKHNTYYQKKNNMCGRLQSKGALSGQGMVREVRCTIFHDYYCDLDINSAHPTITKWICDNIGLKCKYITEYIENRESIFEELIKLNPTYTRGKLKQVFLAVMYGGIKDYNEMPNKNKFIENYKNEISSIHTRFGDVFFKFKEIVQKIAIEKDENYNILGKTASHICCFVENQLLWFMTDYLKNNMSEDKFNNCIMCFDGLMFRSGILDNDKVIQDLEKIYSDMNIPIKLSIKEMKSLDLESMGYDASIDYKYIQNKKDIQNETLESIPENIFDDNESNLANLVSNTDFLDHDVADYFISKFKNYIYYDNKLYYYNGSYWKESIDSYEIIKTLTNEYFYINDIINKSINIHKENINIVERLTKAIKNSKKFLRRLGSTYVLL